MTLTVREVLRNTRLALETSGVEEGAIEAAILAGAVLHADRPSLYGRLDESFPAPLEENLKRLRQRRLQREPLAYILGDREFYGLQFRVSPDALIPRPETELLVAETVRLWSGRYARRQIRIADVGTGSGAVAVSLAVHLPGVRVYATDISSDALAVAQENARRHEVDDRIEFLPGDLLAPLSGRVDVVVANLPYIPSERLATLAPEISRHEPKEALDGGPDGLSLIRRLLAQAPESLQRGGDVLLEMDPEQMNAASAAARSSLPSAQLRRLKDLTGRERVLGIHSSGF